MPTGRPSGVNPAGTVRAGKAIIGARRRLFPRSVTAAVSRIVRGSAGDHAGRVVERGIDDRIQVIVGRNTISWDTLQPCPMSESLSCLPRNAHTVEPSIVNISRYPTQEHCVWRTGRKTHYLDIGDVKAGRSSRRIADYNGLSLFSGRAVFDDTFQLSQRQRLAGAISISTPRCAGSAALWPRQTVVHG